MTESAARHPGTLFRLLLFVTVLVLSAGGEAPAAEKVLLLDPFPATGSHESKADMLIAWHTSQIRGAMVVNIATHNGFFDPAGTLPAADDIRTLLEEGRFDEIRRLGTPLPLRENLFTPRNFIQAAHRLGIVEEMVWVVPRGRSLTEENFRDLKRYYTEEVDRRTGESMRFSDGIVEGHFSGMPVRICTLAEIAGIEVSPAIISFDMDFFSSLYENPMKKSLLGILSETVTALRAAALPCRFAGLTASFFGGHAPLVHTFLADALLSLIRDPSLFTKKLDPRWSAVNEAFRRETLGDIDGALGLMRAISERHPDYAYPYYFAATHFFRRENDERLLHFLKEAHGRDPSYLRGYVELSVWADRTGRDERGRRILEEALARDGESPMVLYLLGNRARRKGACGEAVRYYERFTAVSGSFEEIRDIIAECRRQPDR